VKAWVKLDGRFFRQPAILEAGKDARDLYLAALGYCAEYQTGGFIPRIAIDKIRSDAGIDDATPAAARLLSLGLWVRADGDYTIGNYLGCGFQYSDNQSDRRLPEYDVWRRAVLWRDLFTCQDCGAKGTELQAHHIEPWATFPALRFDVSNGLTLCIECHRAIHSKETP
jgi:hypothetical protein